MLKSFWIGLFFILTLELAACDAGRPVARSSPVRVGEAVDVADIRLLSGERRPVVAPGRRATLLAFWATWCQFCVAEMPDLSRFHANWSPNGIEVVGINTGEPTRRVKAFLQDHALPYPIVVDRKQKLMAQFGLKGVPALVLVDQKGVVRYVDRHLPEEPRDLERMLSDL